MAKRLYRNDPKELLICCNRQSILSIHISICLMKMSMRCHQVEAHKF